MRVNRRSSSAVLGFAVALALAFSAMASGAGAHGISAGAFAPQASPLSPPTEPPEHPTRIAAVHVTNPPTPEFPSNETAVGSYSNPLITGVGDALWAEMVGYSYSAGCPIARAALRVVHINFWGYDGIRHRGSIVVREGYATGVSLAFATLYGLKFRIRRMGPMGKPWGHTPGGYPGADDRKAMAQDNTSAFNCRYVTYSEGSHSWSPHRCGWAIDVNPWENPEEISPGGARHPNDYWFTHRTGAGVLQSSSGPAVKAFTSRGYTWGGTWNTTDYQHFQISGSTC